MPVEPPVSSPRTLGEAYSLLAGDAHRPVAGGTDLLVQITGEREFNVVFLDDVEVPLGHVIGIERRLRIALAPPATG